MKPREAQSMLDTLVRRLGRTRKHLSALPASLIQGMGVQEEEEE